MEGSTYFVTFRVQSGTLDVEERRIVLEHIKAGHGKYYFLIGVVVMPDHAHVILRPNIGIDLSRITKGTKGVTARLVNGHRGSSGHLWQDESWDRILRDQRELDEKLGYILDNPVRAGLVEDGWTYDALFINEEAE
jgi:REP element-mobilizing transposase RayT